MEYLSSEKCNYCVTVIVSTVNCLIFIQLTVQRFFTHSNELEPNNPLILHEMGTNAYYLNDYKTALKHFSEAERLIEGKLKLSYYLFSCSEEFNIHKA